MNTSLRWLSLILLDQPELPEVEAFGRAFQANATTDQELHVGQSGDRLLTCTVGDFTAAITLIDKPVPWEQLEGPCETAWYWPTAADELRDHQAHLLVTLIDEGGRSIEKSTILTQLAAAAVTACQTVRGVFWGPGRLVHPRDGFLGQAEQMDAENLPLFLWIDFRVEQVEASICRLYTTGLEALGQTEIEVERFAGTPQELLEHAYNIAHYLLIGSKAVEDTHIIGLTDELQAIVSRGPSFLDADLEVLQLSLETTAE